MDPARLDDVTCLIVDDLDENLLALEALLTEPGVRVIRARSGAEALERLLVEPVALALLDVQMPEMDGFELAELMRGSERTRHVPIIFVTAGVGDPWREFKGYESGAVDFLFKPIDARVLRSKAHVFFELQRQRLRLAAELREKTEMLRASELFTAILGHDLRGPLSAIVMSAMVLEKKAADDATRRSAGRVLSSAKSMSRMIEDLLDLARARLGRGIAVRREPGKLEEVLRRVADESRAANPDRAIALAIDGDTSGAWDADRLAQVASNLLGNALRHGTPKAGVEVAVDGRDPDAVSLSVSNGGRIPSELLPHVFDPFRGREMRSGQGGGLGLGLFIVREIVEAHGGTVEVESGEGASESGGERTVFTVRLPRRES